MKFTIPPIKWSFAPTTNKSRQSRGTFIKYTIHNPREGEYLVYYGNGRAKQFKTLEDATEWVETVHYPAQVAKYFTPVEE